MLYTISIWLGKAWIQMELACTYIHAYIHPYIRVRTCLHGPRPQENVWAWVEDRLRKVEKKQDTFSVFKRRIVELAKAYPNKEALIPSVAKRVAKCIRRKGANIGK